MATIESKLVECLCGKTDSVQMFFTEVDGILHFRMAAVQHPHTRLQLVAMPLSN